MGIYRDNLSAIVIGDNFLPIIVNAQNSLDLSITDIAFVIYFVIADKLSRQTIVYAHSVQSWGVGAMAKFTASIKFCCNSKNLSSLCLIRELLCSIRELLSFLEKSRKTLL